MTDSKARFCVFRVNPSLTKEGLERCFEDAEKYQALLGEMKNQQKFLLDLITPTMSTDTSKLEDYLQQTSGDVNHAFPLSYAPGSYLITLLGFAVKEKRWSHVRVLLEFGANWGAGGSHHMSWEEEKRPRYHETMINIPAPDARSAGSWVFSSDGLDLNWSSFQKCVQYIAPESRKSFVQMIVKDGCRPPRDSLIKEYTAEDSDNKAIETKLLELEERRVLWSSKKGKAALIKTLITRAEKIALVPLKNRQRERTESWRTSLLRITEGVVEDVMVVRARGGKRKKKSVDDMFRGLNPEEENEVEVVHEAEEEVEDLLAAFEAVQTQRFREAPTQPGVPALPARPVYKLGAEDVWEVTSLDLETWRRENPPNALDLIPSYLPMQVPGESFLSKVLREQEAALTKVVADWRTFANSLICNIVSYYKVPVEVYGKDLHQYKWLPTRPMQVDMSEVPVSLTAALRKLEARMFSLMDAVAADESIVHNPQTSEQRAGLEVFQFMRRDVIEFGVPAEDLYKSPATGVVYDIRVLGQRVWEYHGKLEHQRRKLRELGVPISNTEVVSLTQEEMSILNKYHVATIPPNQRLTVTRAGRKQVYPLEYLRGLLQDPDSHHGLSYEDVYRVERALLGNRRTRGGYRPASKFSQCSHPNAAECNHSLEFTCPDCGCVIAGMVRQGLDYKDLHPPAVTFGKKQVDRTVQDEYKKTLRRASENSASLVHEADWSDQQGEEVDEETDFPLNREVQALVCLALGQYLAFGLLLDDLAIQRVVHIVDEGLCFWKHSRGDHYSEFIKSLQVVRAGGGTHLQDCVLLVLCATIVLIQHVYLPDYSVGGPITLQKVLGIVPDIKTEGEDGKPLASEQLRALLASQDSMSTVHIHTAYVMNEVLVGRLTDGELHRLNVLGVCADSEVVLPHMVMSGGGSTSPDDPETALLLSLERAQREGRVRRAFQRVPRPTSTSYKVVGSSGMTDRIPTVPQDPYRAGHLLPYVPVEQEWGENAERRKFWM
jgi:hypothetical protein